MDRDQSGNSFSVLADAGEHVAQSNGDEGTSNRPPKLKYPLIWIDLEMTGTAASNIELSTMHDVIHSGFSAGLDVEKDQILQIACILTDGDLTNTIEGEEIVIHQPEEVLAGMNEWCVETHSKSGLTQAVRESTVALSEAESRTLEFIQRHIPEASTAQIAGNSVHVDVSFLKRHMPQLVEYAHYRIVDVSTIGELCRRWYPRIYGRAPKKVNAHTAMSDIRESIQQLRYYKKSIFRNPKDLKH